MQGQTIILRGDSQRQFAHKLVDLAPVGAVLNIKEAKRTLDQNSKLWAMLSDVSRSHPQGRKATPERWKYIFMQSLGHAMQFEFDLDGQPFAIGHSTSNLKKADFADLIEFIYEYGSRNGVVWTEPQERAA